MAMNLLNFNSIKVQLELVLALFLVLVLLYFNSIKVQLELSNVTVREDFKEFQFHKGTIRT